MNRSREVEDALNRALRAVAAEDAHLGAAPAVESLLLGEARAVRRVRRRTTLKAYGTAAVLTIAVSAAALSVREPLGNRPADSSPTPDVDVATEFFPLFYSRVPANALHLVRLEVSTEALASFGVEAAGSTGASGTILADVLIGDDGLARAIRFVERSPGQFEEPRP